MIQFGRGDKMAKLRNFKLPLRSISLSIKDIEKIYERLIALVESVGARETAALTPMDNEAQQAFETRRQIFRTGAYRVSISIKGSGDAKGNYGAEIEGEGIDLFRSPEVPESIDVIFLTNISPFAALTGGRTPHDSFQLLFDFSRPKLINGATMPSAPTPNASNLDVSGRDDWVSAVKDAVEKTTTHRKTKRYGLHAPMIYDLGLMVVAVPIALYVCWRLSSFVNEAFGQISAMLVTIAFIYLIFFCLWIYRMMFGYLKWAFPIVELTDTSTALKHRAAWLALLVLIGLPILIDVFDHLFLAPKFTQP
jgi:hypothetical protein